MGTQALDLPGISQLQSETLPQRVAVELTSAILAGGLEPGSPLPSFGKLADRFGVSRPVVREAVRILATQGLIEVRHGRVPMVAADDARPLREGLSLSVRRRGGSFRDLYEVRRMLETEAAALAALRRTDEDIAHMRAALEQMRRQVDIRHRDDIEADLAFHQAVTDAAHNTVLSTVMDPLMALLWQVLRATPAAQDGGVSGRRASTGSGSGGRGSSDNTGHDDGTAESNGDGEFPVWSYEAHEQLFKRIVAQDTGGAREAALKHLELSEARWATVEEPLSALIARATGA